jgi:hypothetical protein
MRDGMGDMGGMMGLRHRPPAGGGRRLLVIAAVIKYVFFR